MTIARDFKRSIVERAGRDPAFAKAMLHALKVDLGVRVTRAA